MIEKAVAMFRLEEEQRKVAEEMKKIAEQNEQLTTTKQQVIFALLLHYE